MIHCEDNGDVTILGEYLTCDNCYRRIYITREQAHFIRKDNTNDVFVFCDECLENMSMR